MKLAEHAVVFEAQGLPLVGNLRTGGLIGLTPEGFALCMNLQQHQVAAADVPESCHELMQHLAAGGYLAEAPDANAGEPDQPERVTSAYLHVTQRCNLSCAFCYSQDALRNTLPDPTLCELQHALDVLATLGLRRLVISGGEPFLRDDLSQIARHAKDVGVQEVVVLTNGLLCSRDRVQPLVGLVDCLAVAFDGYDETCAPHLRGRRVFTQAVQAVRTSIACGITARVLPTIHAGNLDDLVHYQELATSLGASVSYSLLTAPTNQLGQLALSEEQLERLGALALQSQLAVGEDLTSGGIHITARNSCGACTRTLSVAADGSVYPCHMLHERKLALGNAFTDEPAALMSHMKAHPCASVTVDAVEGCRTCTLRYLCGGGCRARAYLDTGHLDGADPSCKLYRTYYSGVMNALARMYTEK